MVKTIEYTTDYEIIKEIELEKDFIFQEVKFKNGHYGVNYINPTKGINEVVLVSKDPTSIGPESFMEFAEMSQVKLDIKEAEKVELCIFLKDKKESEVFRELITGDEASTLVEKLEIAREITELKQDNKMDHHLLILDIILLACIFINLISAIHNMGGI